MWNDAQSAVGLSRIIQVDPNSKHLFEKVYRRLHMRDTVFCAPWAESGHFGMGTNGNC